MKPWCEWTDDDDDECPKGREPVKKRIKRRREKKAIRRGGKPG